MCIIRVPFTYFLYSFSTFIKQKEYFDIFTCAQGQLLGFCKMSHTLDLSNDHPLFSFVLFLISGNFSVVDLVPTNQDMIGVIIFHLFSNIYRRLFTLVSDLDIGGSGMIIGGC